MSAVRGKSYNFDGGPQVFVPNNLGSSTTIRRIGEDEYEVSTKGSKLGSKPVVRTLTGAELEAKYPPNKFERSPETDCYVRSGNNGCLQTCQC